MAKQKYKYIIETGKGLVTEIYTLDEIEKGKVNVLNYSAPRKIIARLEFTGIKDKNDVEIYEGDIARIEKCFTNGIDTLSDHIGEIKYSNCRFMVIDEFFNSLCPYEYKNQIEVVGNKYLNPELLESK